MGDSEDDIDHEDQDDAYLQVANNQIKLAYFAPNFTN